MRSGSVVAQLLKFRQLRRGVKNKLCRLGRMHTRPAQVATFVLALSLCAISAAAQTSIFKIQTSPNPNTIGNTINAVTAISRNDAWAVGYQNDNNLNDSRSLTLHWDGLTWKTIPSPNPGNTPACNNTANVLNAVTAIATNDVWAVGFSWNSCTADLIPMAIHWNGTKWTTVATPITPAMKSLAGNSAFNGVVSFASNNVLAVGYQPAANGAVLTLVERWDGSKWSIVSTPNGSAGGQSFSAVSASSPNDIWAVGSLVVPNSNKAVLTFVEHFNGSTWSIIPSPSPIPTGVLNANVLLSVHAVSSIDVTAVGFVRGFGIRTFTLVEHWDGVKWSVVSNPNPSQSVFSILTGLAVVSPSDMYVVGYSASPTSGQHQTLVEHFDGAKWTIVASPKKGLAQQLNGAFALPNTQNVWIGGAFSLVGIDPEFGLLQIPKSLVMFTPIG
jgi:hypothetical protein